MTLIETVVDYLRKIQALDGNGNPLRELVEQEYVCVDPRGHWDEYYMMPPFWQYRPIDVHKSRFESIDASLQRTNFNQVQQRALRDIPDSQDTTIIELGSSSGTLGAGYLAQHKPRCRVILIDKTFNDTDEPLYLFNQERMGLADFEHILTFSRGKELLNGPKGRERLQQIYQANSINNVELYEHELTPQNIVDFFTGINVSGNIYLFGHKSPRQLGYTAALAYNQLNARFMCTSLTAQENIRPQQFPWKIIQRNLELSDSELRGYIESVFDEKTVDNSELSKKYDYSDPAQKRIALMLKLGMALSLAKEVNGEVLRNSNDNKWFNQIDHYVIAKK